jgi:DNA-binding NtrC family response regulator
MSTALLLEDDDLVGDLIRGILERAGFKVLQATSASQALEHSVNHCGPIRLLIADVMLNEKTNGVGVANTIMDTRAEMFCLFISGYPVGELYNRSLLSESTFTAQLVDFLRKPFTPRRLLETIERMVPRNRPDPTSKYRSTSVGSRL